MRVRLFWKILFSFWLTFICIMVGVWIIFTLYNEPHRPPRWRRPLALWPRPSWTPRPWL